MSTWSCNKCGIKNSENNRFCTNCGREHIPYNQSNATYGTNYANNGQTDYTVTYGSQDNQIHRPAQHKSGGHHLWIVVLVCILVVGGLWGSGYATRLYDVLFPQDTLQEDTTQGQTGPSYPTPTHSGVAYDIGIPNLNGKVYYENDMNVHVLWVHYQLKATGRYYQGDNWDETGNLGDTTMEEIAKFMKANGYPGHNGRVDQDVIDTLATYLGSRRVPVYAGGFYEKMNTIMTGGSEGSMQKIDANSSSIRIKWVQTCLSKLGYYNSSIDGRFGPGTTRALNRFQAEHGYLQRDYVSLGVARSLIEACYNAGCNLNDLP